MLKKALESFKNGLEKEKSLKNETFSRRIPYTYVKTINFDTIFV